MEGAICVSGETRYESDGSWSVVDSRNLQSEVLRGEVYGSLSGKSALERVRCYLMEQNRLRIPPSMPRCFDQSDSTHR